jgi:hypothetical protein
MAKGVPRTNNKQVNKSKATNFLFRLDHGLVGSDKVINAGDRYNGILDGGCLEQRLHRNSKTDVSMGQKPVFLLFNFLHLAVGESRTEIHGSVNS